MTDLSAELLPATESEVIGFAVVEPDRTVRRKVGRLVEWLPPVGSDCCQCTLLLGMESELQSLAAGQRDVVALSTVRGVSSGLDRPITAVVFWSADQSHFTVIAMPDYTAPQAEILFGSERRSRRLMEQQLEAVNSQVRYASLARTRLRLARDLHDTLVHSIMALLTQIRVTRHFLSSDPARVPDALATAEEAAISGLSRARDAIARLRMPDDFEQAPDVEEMLADFSQQTGIRVAVHIGSAARDVLHSHTVTVQRVVSEALRNIERHAKAGEVFFRADTWQVASGTKLLIEISDDGCGFDPVADRSGHFGLTGMAEIAELAGGECVIESSSGKGTRIRLSLPAPALSVPPSSNTLSHGAYQKAEAPGG